ncbi:MAG: YabP/YqfC family sporulation protein [Clostridia bacterium]|nr:YabP/YqfC family sporulation protein [Clostridia bacterium]
MKIKKHKSFVNIRKIKKVSGTKEKMVDRIADFLEMPEELVGDNTKITLVDNKYLYLEGKNQIMDYYDHYIKIKTKKVTITLDGKKMEIKEINDNELVIEGEMLNISYNK